MEKHNKCTECDYSKLEKSVENIRRSIDSARNWMISTLILALCSTLYFGFSIGEWKGDMERRVSIVEKFVQSVPNNNFIYELHKAN